MSPTGEQSHAQIEAFEDTWHWTDEAEQAFDEVMHGGNSDAAELLRAVRAFLKENDIEVSDRGPWPSPAARRRPLNDNFREEADYGPRLPETDFR